jgi:hypothetical protein
VSGREGHRGVSCVGRCVNIYEFCPLLKCCAICNSQWKPWFHNTISAVAALDVDEASSFARRVDQRALEAVLELKSAVGSLVEVEELGCETEFLCGEAHSKLHSPMCQVCT